MGNLIRTARTGRRMSQAALARVADVSQPMITAYEAGKKAPSPEIAAAIARELGLDPDHLVSLAAGVPAKRFSLPEYGEVPCGPPANLPDGAVEQFEPVDLAGLFGEPDGLFVLRAKGTSMTGRHVAPGDKLVVRRTDQGENGRTVVALVDGAATLKVLVVRERKVRGQPVREVQLHACDESTPPIVVTPDKDVRVVGVLVGVVRKV